MSLDYVRSARWLLVKWDWCLVPLMVKLLVMMLFLGALSLYLSWSIVGDVEVWWHNGSKSLLNYIADSALKSKDHLLHFICNCSLQNF